MSQLKSRARDGETPSFWFKELHRSFKPPLKGLVLQRLLGDSEGPPDMSDAVALRKKTSKLLKLALAGEDAQMPEQERNALCDQIVADALELGPLAALLDNEAIGWIMIVGTDRIFVNLGPFGMRSVPAHFQSEQHLRRAIDTLIAPLGRRLDESQPILDVQLPNGLLRVNVILPPVALDGTVVAIRRRPRLIMVQQIIDLGTATVEVMEFLRACVIAGFNILVSGGARSGKTTLLNILCGFIPLDERIVTIEHIAELQLQQPHVVRLVSRPADNQGTGEINPDELLRNALRIGFDRLVVGELRGGEAFHLIEAMFTGSDGSMATTHGSSIRDALSGLETKFQMANRGFPVRAVREQIASSLHLIVQQDRLRDGTRRITRVSEIQGMEGDVITLADLFVFEQTGTEHNRIVGHLKPTGLLPKNMDKINYAGIRLPPNVFGNAP